MKKTAYKETRFRRGRNKGSSQIDKLDPYLDEEGIIKVEERLSKLNLDKEDKYLIVLPKGSPLSELITGWCHKKTGHPGRGMTLNEIQTSGFWIVCANSAACKFIHYCCMQKSESETWRTKNGRAII